jgi:glycosyltransferase involved in cell wall biosynthesis
MIVSIGMLAWNEESRIGDTIRSLLEQSVFGSRQGELPVSRWELIIVPNGCSDATAKIAADTLVECLADRTGLNISGSVVEVGEAGKSNAWNRYVHEFSNQQSDLIIMIDSDIVFGHPDTIFNSVKLLLDRPECLVAVDRPLKDFARKLRRSLVEELSLQFSNLQLERGPAIAGSFYCAKGEILRRIWMPKGIPGEDGFLKAMIVTDCFRSEADLSRIARAENATHFYEGLTRPGAIFTHEVRLVVGTTLNSYFNWDFLKFATDPKGPGAGYLVKSCLENDPDWYRKYIDNQIRIRGWWVLPRGLPFRRLLRLRDMAPQARLRRAPLALIGFLFDLSVCLVANRLIKQGRAIGFW